MKSWRVVPMSPGQLLDVRREDVLRDGSFRKCNLYKGGGGYDRFPEFASKRIGPGDYHLQFVVQLYGCNLDCPFCYVTRQGVWGAFRTFSSVQLVDVFNETECQVFHLMGGAPALTLPQWPDLVETLDSRGKANWVFHSDLMLTEIDYPVEALNRVNHERALYAVGLKGIRSNTFLENTRKELNLKRLWRNLTLLEKVRIKYYVTFTNVGIDEREEFWNEYESEFGKSRRLNCDELVIDLIEYDALPFVDSVPWGAAVLTKQ